INMYFCLYTMIRKRRITLTIDINTYEKFKEVCKNQDIKMSTKINTLITKWLAVQENEKDNFR
ncbi:hypothetical protein ACLIKE_05855, partial [Ferroplasma acidiphilum]|uniref:hypothetical protein n=1 Tax=Ferroplasma acidiphilum TaxID=74969 RepID=UPI001F30B6F6